MIYSTGFGLVFESEMEIPGAILAPHPFDQDEVVRVTVDDAKHARSSDQLYAFDKDVLTFAPPGIGTYEIARTSITISLFPDADIELARDLLVATALPGLLWLRGGFVLHAAGIRMTDSQSAIAIIGPSGSGKSSVAKMLVDAGASLVGDDSLAVTTEEDDFKIEGLSGGMFLGRNDQRKFHIVPDEVSASQSTLAGVLVITKHGPSERLTGVGSVEQLLANRHRPAIPALLGQTRRGIEMACAIAQSVPVRAWCPHEGNISKSRDDLSKTISKMIAGECG
jgi:hypothetical protein